MFNGDRLAFVKGYKRKNGVPQPKAVSAIPQSIDEETHGERCSPYEEKH